MQIVAVTGGSGGLGRQVIKHLTEHGIECVNFDIVPSPDKIARFHKIDLKEYGQVKAILTDFDAIVHLGSNPHPDDAGDFYAAADRFDNNTVGTYNCFNAAAANEIPKVIWASSETVYGFPYENIEPKVVPVREDDKLRPQNSYAISKVLCEDLAQMMSDLYGTSIVGLRFSNVIYTGSDHRDVYQKFPTYWDDARSRKFNLWNYIDARDAAEAVRLSLLTDIKGSENFNIAAQDGVMMKQNDQLLDEVFKSTKRRDELTEHGAMLCSKKAEKMLGWKAKHSWRDILKN